MNPLPAGGNTRVDELVVEPEWHRQQQEQPEGDARQRVAEELPPCLLGKHCVPGHVGRQEPEVHQRMAGEPEVGAGELRIRTVDQPERPRNQHGEDLDRHTKGGDLPHDHRDEPTEGHQRSPGVRILLAPVTPGEDEPVTFDPATDYDERQSDVEEPVGLERRIEGVENAGFVEQDRHRRSDQADDHRPEPDPIEHRVLERPLQTVDRRECQKTGDEKRREHQCVQDTMQGQALVVRLDDGLEQRIEVDAAVLERL